MHTLMNSAGCDSVVTLDLSINQINNTLTQNGNSLSANQIGASYQLLDCGNNYSIMSGANSQIINAGSNGANAVEITKDGC